MIAQLLLIVLVATNSVLEINNSDSKELIAFNEVHNQFNRCFRNDLSGDDVARILKKMIPKNFTTKKMFMELLLKYRKFIQRNKDCFNQTIVTSWIMPKEDRKKKPERWFC